MSNSICTPLETLATLISKATFFQLKMLDYGPQKMRRSMWSWAHGTLTMMTKLWLTFDEKLLLPLCS
jgi:hypothetical protein